MPDNQSERRFIKMSGKKGVMRDKGTSGLTILLTAEDRANLNRMIELVNHVLLTKVSQASIVRRAVGHYANWLEGQLAGLALAAGDEGSLGQFLRAEKASIYEANDIPRDGIDPAKEYPRVAEEEIQVLRQAIKGMNVEEIREFLKTGVKPTIQ
jgi:hypothetical protein